MKINYDILMEEELKKIKEKGEKPSLLLHSCCAPCSCSIIEYLLNFFDITIFFYNPNITEQEEYLKRFVEQKEYLERKGHKIEVVEGRYNPRVDFFERIKGEEKSREGGQRCYKCYELRLEETAKKAKEENYDYFTTVLSISPMKNSAWINEIGEELSKIYQVKFLNGDFKKKGRYLEAVNLSKEYELYRQDYCGCIFSKLEREEYKKNRELEKKEEEK